MSPTLRVVSLVFVYFSTAAFIVALVLFYLFGPNTGTANAAASGFSWLFWALGILAFLVVAYLGSLVITKRKTPSQIIIGIGMSTLGFLFARLTLHFLNPWYLAKGRIGNLYPEGQQKRTNHRHNE